MKKIIFLFLLSFFFACESNSLGPVDDNSATTWGVVIRNAGQFRWEVYNSFDVKVNTPVDAYLTPGEWRLIWFNDDVNGNPVPKGIYRLEFYYDNKPAFTNEILLR